MILGPIEQYYGRYKHLETGREVEILDANLQVKTDREWQTCVHYQVKDDKEAYAKFAVPVDDFRKRFERVEEK